MPDAPCDTVGRHANGGQLAGDRGAGGRGAGAGAGRAGGGSQHGGCDPQRARWRLGDFSKAIAYNTQGLTGTSGTRTI